MNKYLKYFKVLLYIFIPLFIFNLFFSIFYYFNIIDDNISNYLIFINTIISMLIGGIYIGRMANRNGYLEGIKIGLFIVILFLLINWLGLNSFKLKYLVYYLILIISSTIGSMIGISKK